jgi:hypothetical protein
MTLMRLKPKKIVRPVITPFPEETMELAQTVAQEYRDIEDGHHERLRGFLGRAYSLYRAFQQDKEAYEKLKDEKRFWKISRQKPPKDLKTSNGSCCTSCERRRGTLAPGVDVRQDP